MKIQRCCEYVHNVGRLIDRSVHSQLAKHSCLRDQNRLQHTRQSRKAQQATYAATRTAQPVEAGTKQHPNQLPLFDWRNQWYPVHFARDLPEGKPQRVYIFDEPIVLLKRPGDQGVVALRDRCPHRAAALSEGRMTPDGQLQCAYHGWSFDGASGICTNIPQAKCC